MRSCLLIIVMLLLSATGLMAQHVSLKGKVTNELGEPMEMVHVRQSKTLGTTTNFKGEYELQVPESDSLTITFTFIGYVRVEKTLSTTGKERSLLNVQMRPNPAYINDVEVVTQRQNTEANERIETQTLRQMPATSGNTVESLIGTMAGVKMNNEMSSQYAVRGGSFDENLVYVNGIEIYRPQLIASGQQEGLSFINPEMVKEVNFSAGGFGATYGDRMSSVLDVTYRLPDSLEASASIGLMGAQAAAGMHSRHWTQLHGVRYKSNASLLSSLDTKGEYDPRFFDYQTLVTFAPNEKWSLQLLGNIATNHYNFVPKTRETAFGTLTDAHRFKVYFDGKEKDRFDTGCGALTLSYHGLKQTELALMASAFVTHEKVTYDIAGEYWLDEATEGGQNGLGVAAYHEHARNKLKATVAAVSLKGTSQLGHHKLKYGISAQQERIEDRIAEWERRDSAGYTLPHTGDKLQMIYNLHSFYNKTTQRYAAYVQEQIGWDAMNGRWLLTAGVRLSHWSLNRETLVSPRVQLLYRPQSDRWRETPLTLRVAGGLYYQAPFYKEYREQVSDKEGNTMVVMNTDIKSQQCLQLIVGADYTFKAYDRPFKLTAEAYVKRIDNYVPYTVDNVQIRYAGHNTGEATGAGIDMKLYGQFVPGTDSWISLSLMRAQENYDGIKSARPTEQRYGVSLFFSDYWPGNENYRIALRGVVNDGLPFCSPTGGREAGMFRTPAYRRVDLGAQRIWNTRKGQWVLAVDVFNLLDIDNVNSYYWVTAVNNTQFAVPNYLTGRMVSCSVTARW